MIPGQRRARQCTGNKELWFIQEWREDCIHPRCEEDGHWTTFINAGPLTEDKAKGIVAAHNRALQTG